MVRVSGVRPVCSSLAFECAACLSVQSVHQPCGQFQEPVRCASAGGCAGRRFTALREHRGTLVRDRQSVRLQECAGRGESGQRVPR